MANRVPLNVFIVGDSVYYNDSRYVFFQLYQANPFLEIGNHSFSHAYKHYHFYDEHPAGVVKDFDLNDDTLCLQTKTARLPGRNTWRINGRKKTDLPDDSTAADMLSEKNFHIFGRDLEWRCNDDSCHSIQNANILMQKIEGMVQKNNSFIPGNIIILCHEAMFLTADNRI
ncbi:MAG TPA: hypothetical protein VKI61_17275 [Chitinophagaceae bacterium]|nr:hypothetical protein [Chitinophagaceae bacterium]